MIFGTDGIRGIVDKSINSKLVYNVGKAYAKYIDNFFNINRKQKM